MYPKTKALLEQALGLLNQAMESDEGDGYHTQFLAQAIDATEEALADAATDDEESE